MTHHLELLQKLFSAITKAMSIILLIVTFFILQYLLDMDYICSCNPDSHRTDAVFMAAPPLILNFLVTLIESFYKKTMYRQRCRCLTHFLQLLSSFLVKYFFLSGIWAAAVLLEGDWFICLMTNNDRNHTGIACKENLTNEEKHIKAQYKNDSMDIGFAVLCGLFMIWNIYEFSKPTCMRVFNKNIKFSGCPSYYRWVYEELLSEEVSNHLKGELKIIAQEKAKKLCEEYLNRIRKVELQTQTENHNSNNAINSNSNDNPNPNNSEIDTVSTDTRSCSSLPSENYTDTGNPNSNADQKSEIDILVAWHKISEPYFCLNNDTQVGQS